MTSDQLVERALRLIVPTPPVDMRASLRSALLVGIRSSLSTLAGLVSVSDRAELLRTTFSPVTAVNGVAPLTALMAASEPLLLESRLEVFLVGVSYPAEPVPDRLTLQVESSVEFPFYCIEGTNIHVRQANEDYGTYNDTVTIIGSRIPLLSTLPVELEDLAASTLAASFIKQGV